MLKALKAHWPEYLMEAAGLGLFMISACAFALVLEHPDSPVRHVISDPFVRRVFMGLAMGGTAVAIIYSPWGQQSGAHLNPAVTLTFLRLGKVAPWDAAFYVASQFVGGLLGVLLVALGFSRALAHPSIAFAATVPGPSGQGAAFVAEGLISFLLMLVVLSASNAVRWARFTGLLAGGCVAAFIMVEAPFSGMSLNPARTFASALLPRLWDGLWIYFTAPTLAMLLAAEVFTRVRPHLACAKLDHPNHRRCIFCEYQAAMVRRTENGRAVAVQGRNRREQARAGGATLATNSSATAGSGYQRTE